MENKLKLLQTFLIHQGEQRIYSHYSYVLQCEMRFAIFLPKESLTDKQETYASIYYLSGLGCSERNSIEKLGFQRFASRYETIFVCPDTSPRGEKIPDDDRYWVGQGAGFYVNATKDPWKTNYKMYDYIDSELPALIDRNFPTSEKRSICGHSMGGLGALILGLRNPERYACISAFAPVCDLTSSQWACDALSSYLGSNQENWSIYNPSDLIKNIDNPIPILIDQGDKDEFIDQLSLEEFKKICESIDYPATINNHQGYDHSTYFIQSFIANHFVFHADNLDIE